MSGSVNGVQRFMLKSKIHRATVTQADVDYEGSLTLDANLLRAADILPFEQVHVWNVTRGSRLQTYAMEGEAGSGVVCINGAAARLTHPGGHHHRGNIHTDRRCRGARSSPDRDFGGRAESDQENGCRRSGRTDPADGVLTRLYKICTDFGEGLRRAHLFLTLKAGAFRSFYARRRLLTFPWCYNESRHGLAPSALIAANGLMARSFAVSPAACAVGGRLWAGKGKLPRLKSLLSV